jgi:microcystin-dependent protein
VSEPYVGEIRMFAGNFGPAGWMLCQGQLLPISEYETLFNLIGTTYGGDGVNTFALPNLQSRVPIHFGGGFTLAETGGVESVTLTVPQIPIHTHAAMGVAGSANGVTSPTGNTWGGVTANTPYTDQPHDGTMNSSSIAMSGGSQPHDNMLPFLAINFIISLFGVFPSQT